MIGIPKSHPHLTTTQLNLSAVLEKGKSACLVLVQRDASTAVFLSSDGNACQAAQALGVSFLTIPDVLTRWICNTPPSPALFQELIEGMRNARFTLSESVLITLQNKLL